MYKVFIFIVIFLFVLFYGLRLVEAQNNRLKTDSRILYHNGPVKLGTVRVYVIFYGNWSAGRTGNNAVTQNIIGDFISGLSGSPYFLINTTYPDSNGNAPSGGLVYAGAVGDEYSRGPSLTTEDIQAIVVNQIDNGSLPLDTTGIYLVIASDDVTNINADGSTFCTPGIFPHRGRAPYMGTGADYGFIGNPMRCPTSAGGHFNSLTTPNNDFAADAMATSIAHVLNVIVTNQLKDYGWFDRYGLENSGKCFGKFGTTYTTANGARANMRLAGRDFLVQQNWLNSGRAHCSLSIVQ